MRFIAFLGSVFYCCTLVGLSHNTQVLVVAGASCSGKSTLAHTLVTHLGSQWHLVEFDELEEQYKMHNGDVSNDDIMQAVVEQTNLLLAQEYNVIIDTNVVTSHLDALNTTHKKVVFVYCPLQILLERDAHRNTVRQRSEKRKQWARDYVCTTFSFFEHFTTYDIKIDSSTDTIEQSMRTILSRGTP